MTELLQEKIAEFEKKINYQFKDKEILLKALTHRSFINENPTYLLGHNERMEFLGDAVLELIVTEFLYKNYGDKPEGELTNLRAALVRGQHLAQVGERFGMAEYILMSKGERNEQSSKDYIVANAVEALIAALYMDGDFKLAEKFVGTFIIPDLDRIIEDKLFIDAKSQLQEITQEVNGVTPSYSVLKEWGPDHDKIFQAGVFIRDLMIGTGQGSSKQKAEQEAAKDALIKQKS